MTINELAAWFADKDDIVVISHVSPDGDAIGSALAVKRAFNMLGKRACVVLADPVPQRYMFLPGAGEICAPDSLPFAPCCAFTVDVSEMKRMGAAQTAFDAAWHKAALDHHETNQGFGAVWHVEGSRASTGELALEFIKALGVTPDKAVADCVFVALCTDTGNFNYKNTDDRAYAAAAECVRYGAQVERLTKLAFRERSFACTKLLGDALAKIELTCGGRVAYTYVDDMMLAHAGARLEDASRICNYLNEITGVLVGVYFEQHGADTKISWRSASEINVADIAAQFGGGGHDAAAGARVNMDMRSAMAAVLAATEAAVKGHESIC